MDKHLGFGWELPLSLKIGLNPSPTPGFLQAMRLLFHDASRLPRLGSIIVICGPLLGLRRLGSPAGAGQLGARWQYIAMPSTVSMVALSLACKVGKGRVGQKSCDASVQSTCLVSKTRRLVVRSEGWRAKKAQVSRDNMAEGHA